MRRLETLALCVVLFACADEIPIESYTLTFAVTADNGDPLEDVVITGNNRELGKTGPGGKLTNVLRAIAGARLRVKATCPEGYRRSVNESWVTLRSYQSLDKTKPTGLFTSFQCRPTKRKVAVIVRADGRAGLPVLRQGTEMARTNKYGVAHVMLELAPNQNVELMLSTTASKNKRLRPLDPTRTFRVPDQDRVITWDQPFEQARGPARKKKPTNRGPREIKSTGNRYGL